MVEQAIFGSAVTERAQGYQLLAASPGICPEDAQALAMWGPSHDALEREAPGGMSINCFPLPSGAWCVSQTSPAGQEFSQRGGQHLATHCLVVPAARFERFAWNAFAVRAAAVARGALLSTAECPRALAALTLLGGASPCDAVALEHGQRLASGAQLGTMVDALLRGLSLGLVCRADNARLLAALVNVLPLEMRRTISFTTGLVASVRRPFRIGCLADDPATLRRVGRCVDLAVVDPAATDRSVPVHPWARLVAQWWQQSRLTELRSLVADLPREADSDMLAERARGVLELSESMRVGPSVSPEAEGVGRDSLLDLTRELRGAPEDEWLWREAERIHRRHLDQLDTHAAAELIFDLCRVLIPVAGAPSAEVCRRLAGLLQAEREQNPQALRQSIRRLESLGRADGRSFWLGLAQQVQRGAWKNVHEPMFRGDETAEIAESPTMDARDSAAESGARTGGALDGRRADAPHPFFQKGTAEPWTNLGERAPQLSDASCAEPVAMVAARIGLIPDPSQVLGERCPAVLEQLELLDDTVFEAIAGRPGALASLQRLWPDVLSRLGGEHVEESKAQYIRHAMQVWQQCAGDETLRNPDQASRALEVLCLLFES